MKILFILHRLSGGGAERNLCKIANHLSGKDFEVHLLILKNSEENIELQSSIQIHRFNFSENPNLKERLTRYPKIRRLIKTIDPKKIISFTTNTNLITLKSVLFLKIPTIISERTNTVAEKMSLSKRAQLSILYPLATTVVLLAEELENWANSRLFKWKTKSIPNPVMEPPKNKYATTSKPEKKIILGMGRFIKRKQFDLLIKIFSRLEKKFPDWNLHIVGDGPERPNLKALIHSLNLEERVFLEQWSNDPYEWYYRAELFAFTSSFEGFGMTLAEALTCQLPVISFDCPYGPSRIIDHQVNGYLVPLDDTKEFENKLGSLMNDEKLRTHLGSNGIKVLDKFSYNTIMKEWETLIRN